VDGRLGELPADREIVFYCTCPNEASAAQVAKKLIGLGYTKVRPLHGGLDARISPLACANADSARTTAARAKHEDRIIVRKVDPFMRTKWHNSGE